MQHTYRFTADFHIGNHKQFSGERVNGLNQRCLETLKSVEQALFVKADDRQHTFVLGDVFDSHEPTSQVVGALNSIARQHTLGLQRKHTLMVGNHDAGSTGEHDHAMSAIDRERFELCGQPSYPIFYDEACSTSITLIAYQPKPASEYIVSEIESMLQKQPECKTKVLCFHAGIAATNTPGFLLGAKDVIPLAEVKRLCRTYGFTHVFAGNWHEYVLHSETNATNNSPHIEQVGSVCPTGFDNDYPGVPFGVTDLTVGNGGGVRVERVEIPGVRFLNFHDVQKNLEAANFPQRVGNKSTKVFIKLHATINEGDVATFAQYECNVARWMDYLAKYNWIDNVHVFRNLTVVAQGVAIEHAKHKNKLQNLITEYIHKMNVPDKLKEKITTLVFDKYKVTVNQ